MSKIEAGLPISAVAARTGVSAPVLRAWELRFGFPRPDRLEGGHRRYREGEVDRISRVVAARETGRSLEAAIALVLGEPEVVEAVDLSVFAGLRRARPDLPVHLLRRRTMLALSRAIEDESLAHAERPHLVAAFQTRAAYGAANARWDDLVDTAAAAIVFADFTRARRRGALREVPIRSGAPLRREWCIVSEAPGFAAALAGWERADGRFEAVWTAEADAVHRATEVGRGLASTHAPSLELPPGPATADAATDPAVTVRRATALTNRVIAYLD